MIISEKTIVTLSYDLYVGDENELMESATPEQPLVFCQGIGMMLPKFETQIAGLKAGDTFDFSISHEDAYGEYDDESLIDLPRAVFEINGKFDEEMIFEGNIVPLMDKDKNRINAQIVSVDDDTVSVDLNHPLAGENLHFVGKILTVRAATDDEIKKTFTKNSRCCGCSSSNDCGDNGCGN